MRGDQVIRGGCWYIAARYCRSALRDHVESVSPHFALGFRIAKHRKRSRVIRSSSWYLVASYCRTANRYGAWRPNYQDKGLGFRIVRRKA